jgi:hypothetical protein
MSVNEKSMCNVMLSSITVSDYNIKASAQVDNYLTGFKFSVIYRVHIN